MKKFFKMLFYVAYFVEETAEKNPNMSIVCDFTWLTP